MSTFLCSRSLTKSLFADASPLCWLGLVAALSLPGQAAGQVSEDSDSDRISGPTATARGDQESRDFDQVVRMIVDQTQAFRQQHDQGVLQHSGELTEASEEFARYMADTGQYGHQADGRRPSQRATAVGYDYCLVSENIAHLFSSEPLGDEELARRFVQGWQESTEHRKNMLEPAVTQTGVAVAQSESSGYIFAVQMFGRPESAAIRFEIANQTQQTLRYQLAGQTLELPPQYTRIHQRCRRGEIELSGEQPTDQASLVFEPRSGERLTVVQGDDGTLHVERQAAETQSDRQD